MIINAQRNRKQQIWFILLNEMEANDNYKKVMNRGRGKASQQDRTNGMGYEMLLNHDRSRITIFSHSMGSHGAQR